MKKIGIGVLVLLVAVGTFGQPTATLELRWEHTASNSWTGTVCDAQSWAPGNADTNVVSYELRTVNLSAGTTNIVDVGYVTNHFVSGLSLDTDYEFSHRAVSATLTSVFWSCALPWRHDSLQPSLPLSEGSVIVVYP